MDKSLLTFSKGGIHPAESKHLTEHLPLEDLPLPDEVEILLNQHFGSPCAPTVKKKTTVLEGDLIGEVKEGLGAFTHSSISGKIKSIGTSPHPVQVTAPSVTIERDPEAGKREYSVSDWKELSRDQLLSSIKNAGIVGIGGAGFPTHVKLSPPPEAKVDSLILNGAECEPYLTTDHRLMVEAPYEILEGAEILATILGVQKCHVGIEANKPDAIEAMEKAATDLNSSKLHISIHPLQVKYPQGSEKQLIESILQRRVPGFGLPFDVGVVVQNVGTARAVYDAVVLKKALYEKPITVSGRGIERQANLRVRIGTRLRDIVSYLGGTKSGLAKVLIGGPMMGFAVPDLNVPVTKTTSGVLFLTEDEVDNKPYSNCIRCGWCLEACPMGLLPNEIGVYVEAGHAEQTSRFGVFECFECGCCAFVCPAKRPLVQFIRLGKMKAKK